MSWCPPPLRRRSRRTCSFLTVAIPIVLITLTLLLRDPPSDSPTTLHADGPAPLITNRDGYQVNFEEPPVHPIEFFPSASNPEELWVCSLPDASLSIFDVSNADPGNPGALPVLKDVIPVGLGPVSVRRRPGPSGEMWVVCTTSNAIFVLDSTDKIVRHVISFYDPGNWPDPKVPQYSLQEPMDVAFDSTGDTAFVSLSVSNHIGVIDAVTKTWTSAFPFGSDFDPDSVRGPGAGIPPAFVRAEEPRALLHDGGTLYALSFESGNGSIVAPSSDDDPDTILFDESAANVADLTRGGKIVNIWRYWEDMTASIHRVDPPDRDIFAFDALGNPVDVTFRVGTLCYDVVKSNNVWSQSLYISNVELHNFDQDPDATLSSNRTCGEEFLATTRPLASHRITVIEPDDLDGILNPNAKELDLSQRTIIDLNDPEFRHPSITANFATPTQICMSSNGKSLLVACYESANCAIVQVVDRSPGTPNLNRVVGTLNATPGSFGPRGVLKDEGNRLVYVYNRGDHSVDRFNLNGFGPGDALDPDQNFSAGLDITPSAVVRGRAHFLNAANSINGQQTCQSCHIEGHMDRLAWCLDNVVVVNPDPGEGVDFSASPLDPSSSNGRKFLARKGPKVTQSLRGIEETPPYHWQGDRSDLIDFNDAFVGLLGGEALTPEQFSDFQAYLFSLSFPPNPRQRLDRRLTFPALAGFDQYRDVKTVDPHVARHTPRLSSCNECHALTQTTLGGGSGTLNQVINDRRTGSLFPDDVPHLRGLFDKEADTARTGFEPPGTPLDSSHALYETPVTGFGFGNNGNLDSILQTLAVFQDLEGNVTIDHNKLAQALEQIDTGVSPALGATTCLTDLSPTQIVADNLVAEAEAGRSELVVRGWWRRDSISPLRRIRMHYDPDQDLFLTDIDVAQQSFDPTWYGTSYSLDDLENMADQSSSDTLGDGEFVLLAVPLGTGVRLGRDRDLDQILDRDEELFYGTSDERLDSDGDGVPDGQEVALLPGDPLAPSDPATTPVDNVHDGVTPSTLRVDWSNSTVARIRWKTEELSTTEVDVVLRSDPSTVVSSFFEERFKTEHTALVRGMTPGVAYSAVVRGTDPSGNVASDTTVDIDLDPNGFFMSHTFVKSVTLQPNGFDGDRVKFVAIIEIVDENGDPIQIEDDDVNPIGAGVIVEVIEWRPGQAFQHIGNPETVLAWNVAQEVGLLGSSAGVFRYEFTSIHTRTQGALVEVIVKEVVDKDLLNLNTRSVREFHAQARVE